MLSFVGFLEVQKVLVLWERYFEEWEVVPFSKGRGSTVHLELEACIIISELLFVWVWDDQV